MCLKLRPTNNKSNTSQNAYEFFENFLIPFVHYELDFAQHERLNVKQAVSVVDGIRKSLGGIRSSHQIGKSITYNELTTYAYVLWTFFYDMRLLDKAQIQLGSK